MSVDAHSIMVVVGGSVGGSVDEALPLSETLCLKGFREIWVGDTVLEERTQKTKGWSGEVGVMAISFRLETM